MNAVALANVAPAPSPGRALRLARPGKLMPLWVAGLYEETGADFKTKLLECLMRPMGALGLVAVASGVFAAVRHRHGWQRLQVTVEDTAGVSADHVYQLASYLQQAAPEVFRQVAELLADNPAALTSVSGLLLLQTLHVAHKRRRPSDR